MTVQFEMLLKAIFHRNRKLRTNQNLILPDVKIRNWISISIFFGNSDIENIDKFFKKMRVANAESMQIQGNLIKKADKRVAFTVLTARHYKQMICANLNKKLIKA